MKTHDNSILAQKGMVITDSVISDRDQATVWIRSKLSQEKKIRLIFLGEQDCRQSFSDDWEIEPEEDREAVRDEFLAFLEDVALGNDVISRKLRNLESLYGGYPLWWTVGPGLRRHSRGEEFAAFRFCLGVRKAIRAYSPSKIVCHIVEPTKSQIITTLLSSFSVDVTFTPMSAPIKPSIPPIEKWIPKQKKIAAENLSASWKQLRSSIFLRRKKKSHAIGKPCVLISTDFPRHCNNDGTNWYWQSVEEALNARGIDCLYVVDVNRKVRDCLNEVTPPLNSVNHALVRVGLTPWQQFKLASRNRRRLKQFENLSRDPAFQQRWNFLGADLACFYEKKYRGGVIDAYRFDVQVQELINSVRATGKNVKAALIHGEFYRDGQANIAAMRAMKIPTIGVQHGSLCPMQTIYTIPRAAVQQGPMPTFFAAWGDYAKQTVSHWGHYPADRVLVTGAPRMDWLVSNPPNQLECRMRLGIPADAFVILITSQPGDWMVDAAKDIYQLVQDDPNTYVCTKLSIQDPRVKEFRMFEQRAKSAKYCVYTDSYHDLLGACDTMASYTTTTLLEAILLGKPTIGLNYFMDDDPYPYVEHGVSLPVRNPNQLPGVLKQIRMRQLPQGYKKVRGAFLEHHLGPTRLGQSSEVLADIILDIESGIKSEPGQRTGEVGQAA